MSAQLSRFGPYELVSRLGAGGMAETFLAVRRGPGAFEQKVCVKRILPAFEQDQDFVRQFLEEARVSAQLRHANIVQVLDFGVVDGSHYLALELVEGMDLHKLLRSLADRGETMTSGLVVYLATELANALEYAHGGGGQSTSPVVHRDISPSNVLVSRAGEVKLTDFGIAKAAQGPGPVPTTGVVKGKVPYMAPEYAMSGKADPRSDLFALGVLLFEALTGRRPFVGQTDLDTLQRILEGRRPRLIDLCPNAPSGLIEAIESLRSRSAPVVARRNGWLAPVLAIGVSGALGLGIAVPVSSGRDGATSAPRGVSIDVRGASPSVGARVRVASEGPPGVGARSLARRRESVIASVPSGGALGGRDTGIAPDGAPCRRTRSPRMRRAVGGGATSTSPSSRSAALAYRASTLGSSSRSIASTSPLGALGHRSISRGRLPSRMRCSVSRSV